MTDRIVNHRRRVASGVPLDVMLVALANYIAFWLRFDGAIPAWALILFMQMLPILVVIRIVLFIPFRLYEGMWRYTSLWDVRNIVMATVLSTLCFHLVVRW